MIAVAPSVFYTDDRLLRRRPRGAIRLKPVGKLPRLDSSGGDLLDDRDGFGFLRIETVPAGTEMLRR
jgi:hypothetical protein